MSTRADLILVLTAIVSGAAAVERLRVSAIPDPSPSGASVTAAKALQAPEPARLQLASAQTSNRDPFRLSRQPSTVPYVPGGAAAPPPTPVIVIPPLTVRGIVGGPPWQAVIDGIPGAPPGSVVKNGSVFDRITFLEVGRDTVVVQLADSVWRITMSRRTP